MGLVGLSIAGPQSRALLQRLTDEDVSAGAFKFMDHRAMEVANLPALVNRVTYTGDLGYEIWVKPEFQRRLYAEITAAGQEFGLINFGMRALLSLRLEKNFPTGVPGRSMGPMKPMSDASSTSTRRTSSASGRR